MLMFKEGVGKTTAHGALGYVAAASSSNLSSLVFDLDAQMSLTQSVTLNEDGNPFKNFTDRRLLHVVRRRVACSSALGFMRTPSYS